MLGTPPAASGPTPGAFVYNPNGLAAQPSPFAGGSPFGQQQQQQQQPVSPFAMLGAPQQQLFASAGDSEHANRLEMARQAFSGSRRTWQPDIPLPNGCVATLGVPHIHHQNDASFPPDARARAATKSAKWVPPGAKTAQYQRSPLFAVDNICVRVINGAIHIAFGLWDKKKEINGVETHIKGLALAAGGHMETMGRPTDSQFDAGAKIYYSFKEPGHMSWREAADAEMKEEICVDKRNVLYTELIATYESPLRDPRSQYNGAAYFRYLAIPPQSSAELKTVVMLNMQQIQQLVNNQPLYMPTRPGAESEELHLVLGHDQLIHQLLSLPNVQELLERAVLFNQRTGL